jgi:hypothetical protein
MKKQSGKKLALHKETLSSLESSRLVEVAAGLAMVTKTFSFTDLSECDCTG